MVMIKDRFVDRSGLKQDRGRVRVRAGLWDGQQIHVMIKVRDRFVQWSKLGGRVIEWIG